MNIRHSPLQLYFIRKMAVLVLICTLVGEGSLISLCVCVKTTRKKRSAIQFIGIRGGRYDDIIALSSACIDTPPDFNMQLISFSFWFCVR